MSHSSRFQKSALAAAVLSLGFSMGALAQGSAGSSASGSTSSGTGAAAAQGGSSGAAAGDRSGSSSAMPGRSGDMSPNQGGMMSRDSATRGSTESSGSGAKDAGKMARSDHKFLEEAYMGSMAEVRLGQLAQQKASSSQVKEFGSRMVADHTKAIEELATIAKADGVQLPSQLDSKHQKTYDKLSKLSGADFDRAYMKEMASDHKKDVNEYEKAAKSAKDDQLQQHAQQTLPTLREHRKMAEAVRDDLQKSSTVSMRTDNPRGSSSSSQSQGR